MVSSRLMKIYRFHFQGLPFPRSFYPVIGVTYPQSCFQRFRFQLSPFPIPFGFFPHNPGPFRARILANRAVNPRCLACAMLL